MARTKQWYITERAEQLAQVHLSRRPDLTIISHLQGDDRLNFLVNLTQHGKSTGRMFGVQVKAKLNLDPIFKNGYTPKGYKLNLEPANLSSDIPFPVCQFAFAMQNDAGYYRWVQEPHVDMTGQPSLRPNLQDIYQELDRMALDKIIDLVNQWYDTRRNSC